MKLKLGTLVKSKDILIKLNNTEGFDSIIAYRIFKNSKAIDVELNTYSKYQAKIVHKYCERDEKGNPVVDNGHYFIKDNNKLLYVSEIEQLFNEDVEINIAKISVESISKACLTPVQIGLIEFMLEV